MRDCRHSFVTPADGNGKEEEEDDARDLGWCAEEGLEAAEEAGGTGVAFFDLSMAASTSSTNWRSSCASPPSASARMSASSRTPMVAATVKTDCQLVAAAALPAALAVGTSGIAPPGVELELNDGDI